MIQSIVSAAAPQPAALPGAILQLDTIGTEATDFGTLLVQSAAVLVPAEPADKLPAGIPGTSPDALAAPTVPAGTGSILPPILPDLAASLPPEAALPQVAVASEEPGAAEPAAQPSAIAQVFAKASSATPRQIDKTLPDKARGTPRAEPGKPTPHLHGRIARTKAAVAETPVPDQVAAPAHEQLPGTAEQPSQPGDTAPATAAVTTLPATPVVTVPPPPVSGADDPQPSPGAGHSASRPLPEPALRALEHAAPRAAFLRAPTLAVSAPQAGQPLPADQTAPPPAARAPAQLRIEVVLPSTAEPAAKPAQKLEGLTRRIAQIEPPAASLVSPEPILAVVQTAVSTLAAAPRPHDFAALVDRLVAAREAVQPQGTTFIVAHSDFGPVELRFRHEEHGLAVSLASADPDFARAAAAAPPTNLPLTSAAFVAAEPGQAASTRDAATLPGGTANGQSRGQHSERRDETAQQSNHGPHRAATRDTERRSGIFA